MGGGFSDTELQPGLYSITAIGNLTPWPSFGAAKGTWSYRADQLCGKGQYQEIITEHDAGSKGAQIMPVGPGTFASVQKFNTTIRGYVLCNSSGMSKEAAIQFIDSIPERNATELREQWATELASLGGSDCSSPDNSIAPDNFYKRGTILMNQSLYKEARVCLLKAVSLGDATGVYRDANEAIGRMYELGWGVTADLPAAKEWYRKAGLL